MKENEVDAVKGAPAKVTLTEGVLIAIAPVLAYAIAWLFEYGYLSYYSVPSSLIQVDIADIVRALAWLLIVAAVVFHSIKAIPWNLLPAPGKFERLWLSSIVIFVLLVIMLIVFIVFPAAWRAILYILAGMALFYLCIYIVGLGVNLILRIYFKFLNRIFAKRGKELASSDKAVTNGGHVRKIIYYLDVLLLAIFVASALSFLGGRYGAQRRDVYMIIREEPKTVVLKLYKDRAICARIKPGTNIIDNNYSITMFSPNETTSFRWERTGRLTPAFKDSLIR